ncbi:MAG: cytochrome c, partial [Roseibacillus sp.]|nr:cytochrome c [Roseibacillus sp.]
TAERGSQIATRYGCLACHSTDGTNKVAEEPSLVVGPTWKGLFQSERTLVDNSTLQANEPYLRESILHPAKRVTRGFETQKTGVGMPSYLGVLNEDQVTSLILYLKSLR